MQSPTRPVSGPDPTNRARTGTRLLGVLLAVAMLLVAAACTKAKARPTPTGSLSGASQPASASASGASTQPGATSTAPSAIAGVDPLTGLAPADPAAATRPALAVKVDNVAGAWPQAGLNHADIVFDLPVEGGLTRLLAVFHSQNVPLVGPIRSARPVDADILPLFGRSYFAFSGGTPSDIGPLRDHSNATLMWWDVTPSLFVTRNDHRVPHQVFANATTLYAGGQARTPLKSPPPAVFSYAAAPPAGAAAATSVTARYQAATATWNWDGTKYLRIQDGRPDMLLDTGQVSTSNVVVMSVSVRGTAARDTHGSVVPLPVVTGSGTAWVFRNGLVVKGIWNRPTLASPLKLLTSDGQIIPLAPGRTWVEVLPNPQQPQIG